MENFLKANGYWFVGVFATFLLFAGWSVFEYFVECTKFVVVPFGFVNAYFGNLGAAQLRKDMAKF